MAMPSHTNQECQSFYTTAGSRVLTVGRSLVNRQLARRRGDNIQFGNVLVTMNTARCVPI